MLPSWDRRFNFSNSKVSNRVIAIDITSQKSLEVSIQLTLVAFLAAVPDIENQR